MLAADGQIIVGGKVVPEDAIGNLFRVAYARDKTTQVIIKADRGVTHGTVVKLMETAKQAGLSRIAIGTAGN